MGKFKEGMRVLVIDEDNDVRKGVINAVYEEMELAIVKFNDGNVEKVPFSYLGIEREPEEKKQSKPVEKSEITITPKEFQAIGVKIALQESAKAQSPIVGLAFSMFLAELHKALFFDEVENG